MSAKRLTRRDFLKLGCLTTATAGLAVCGAGLALTGGDPAPIKLPSFSYGENSMKERILVAYASATGSTVEVAAAIGETLSAHDLRVDVRPIRENPPIDGYRAALIGSAVQHGNWLPEAVQFVKSNQEALSRIPVALFCVHITNLGNDEASRKNRLAFLDAVRPFVQPRAEVFFAGRFDRRGAAMLLPGLVARFVPTMDYRDWKKIRAWADNLQPLLEAA